MTTTVYQTEQGSQIMTFTGKVVDPLNLDPALVDVRDIAHSLSNQCRFTGHTWEFYSVAQHCVLCAEFLLDDLDSGKEIARIGLLHDASEAYLNDLARPVKRAEGFGTIYRKVEDGIQEAIAKAYGLPFPFPDIIHKVDDTLLRVEQRDLMTPWPDGGYPEPFLDYRKGISGWDPWTAEQRYLAMFDNLT